jgi:hypothetical protein
MNVICVSFRYQVQLHAKMDRGFFRADQDWTCYRRNYFQVSATFDVHGTNYMLQGPEVPCLIRTENQEIHQVDFFSIGVCARVTGSDKKIELVQHTPKRDKGPQMIPEPRVVSAGGNLHLASVGSNHNIVTFERMQFKTATANNGKRRAAQQYYEIVVDLCANTSSGKQFKVASSTSAPLVVRGRSPGHYADSHTRYRSMDAGQPSSASSAAAPFGSVGQGAPTGSTTSNAAPPPPPSAAGSSSGPPGHEDHHYMQSPQQPRYGGAPPMNAPPPPPGGHGDFGHPYSYQQPPQGYPYPVSGYAPVMNTTPIGSSSRNEEDANREGGYMMHPYASHPMQPSQQQQQQQQHPSNSGPDAYYDGNNNGHNNDVYGNHHPPHPSDNKPYWAGNNSSRDQPPHLQQQPTTPSSESHHARYNSNGGGPPYSDYGAYPMRPQLNDNNGPSSSNSAMESNPLDAGRSITPDNKQHYMHHPTANSH